MPSQLLKRIGLLSAGTVATVLFSLFRSKLIAYFLGPFGVGLFSQISNLLFLLSNSLGLGIPVSVVRFVAEANGKNDTQLESDYIKTAIVLLLVPIVPLFIVCLFNLEGIASSVLDDSSYTNYVLLGLLTYPIFVVFIFLRGLLSSWMEIKKFVYTNIFPAFILLAALVPMLFLAKAMGAVLSITLYYGIGLLFAYHFCRPHFLRLKIIVVKRSRSFHWSTAGELLKFGIASVIAGLSTYGASFLGRVVTLRVVDLAQLGVFQAAYAIALQSTSIILDSVSTYVLPRLSYVQAQGSIESEYNQFIQAVLIMSTPLITIFLYVPGFLLVLLYSRDFLAGINMLLYLLIGEYFRMINWAVGSNYYPLKKIGSSIVFEIVWAAVYLAVLIFFVEKLALMALVLAYVVAYGAVAVSRLFLTRRLTGISVNSRNWGLIVLGLMHLLLTLFAVQTTNWVLAIVSSAAWLGGASLIVDIRAVLHSLLKRQAQ